MTTRLTSGDPRILRAETIGDAWLAVAGRIVDDGVPSRYDDLPIREISLVTLAVARPDPDDEIIAHHADPERDRTGLHQERAVMTSSGSDPAAAAGLGTAFRRRCALPAACRLS